ncbi:unnamed protein product [Adineta ricciae]|uniref:AIG1-type G domain-containing protein n=1 Tax=Adineta ricciae TaxID=249248 RepID=A0A815AEN4_ADIRI|nr:unnamed protein product [Adineta ricciae]CAF1615623.1 unnamed protein product [Adineta ricciae]
MCSIMSDKKSSSTLRERYRTDNLESKRNKITQEIVQDFKENGLYKMKKVEHVNILIIGRTRTGKSTIKALLVDPTSVPSELTLKSGTRDPQFQAFNLKDKDTVINIIDTPGLFERGSKEVDIRDNDTILNAIKLCATMEITKFHAICFCVSVTVGINREDIQSIETLIEYFGEETSKNSCLIITHCESKNEEQREKLRKELVEDAAFHKIAPFFKLGILFSGSINRDDYNNGSECVYNQYFAAVDYRTQLIEKFLSVRDPLPINQMRISPERSANDLKKQKEDEVLNLRQSLEEQEYIVKQFQKQGLKDEHEIRRLTEKYRRSILREQELRAHMNDDTTNDPRY